MEEIHLKLQEYSHEERNKKILEYLNSLNNKEIKRILKKTFKGYRNYFHFAVLFNYVVVAEVFLKHNANLVTYSLLKYAARKNLTEMICTFLQYTKDFGKVTNIIYEVIYNDNLDVIMFVIKKLECAVSLEVMLVYAAMFGSTQIAEILIIHGADIDFMYRGGTALSYAVKYWHLKTVNLLLSYGASFNIRGLDGLFLIETSLVKIPGRRSLFKRMILYNGLK